LLIFRANIIKIRKEGRAPPQKKIGKIFFGQLLCKIRAFSSKNQVKFGNFVNFSGKEGRAPPPKKIGKIFFGQLLCKIRAFSGKNQVKFGNFVNFSGKYKKNRVF